jgi:putative Holliday junction resolvase
MILADFKDFPRTGRLLGIDWGLRRIGLAVSDENQFFFFARPRIENGPGRRDPAAQIAAVAADEKIAAIVIGLPLRLSGDESETTAAVRAFAGDLALLTDLPIFFVDESLTSAEAAENLAGAGRSDIKKNLDSESARLILENAVAMARRADK